MTTEQEAREQRASERARDVPPGNYHAYNNFVVNSDTRAFTVECETHWDACLVLIVNGGAK